MTSFSLNILCRFSIRILFAGMILSHGVGHAQTIAPFKSLRYEEDYHFLRADTARSVYEKSKYKPLSRRSDSWISFGGDIRYQYFLFKNEDWGEGGKDDDGYLLTRYLIHADLHSGNHFRTFVQLQSSLANGMEGSPSPVDENQLDFHQGFVDLSFSAPADHRLLIRIGRQELSYGSQRLVSVREGPNNRQSFDAARLILTNKRIRTDLFYSNFVRARQKIFDDGFNKNTKFWGSYSVVNKLPVIGNLDLYYLGLWKSKSTFDNGAGTELRHSTGARIWKSVKNLRYDIEGVYQAGKLADQRITAWTISLNGGYKFTGLKFEPELGLKTELISGNKFYQSDRIQTFNPLFPRGGYFGLASLIGPSNLFDIHPSVVLKLADKVEWSFDSDIFWRHSKNDGIYAPNASLIYSGKNSRESFIGSQFSSDISYAPNNFLYFRVEFTWFNSGPYLKEVGPGKDILFMGVTSQLKF